LHVETFSSQHKIVTDGVLFIFCFCSVYFLLMFCLFSVYVLLIFCLCSVYFLLMFCLFSAYVLFIFCLCSVNFLLMFCLFSAYILFIFARCFCLFCVPNSDVPSCLFQQLINPRNKENIPLVIERFDTRRQPQQPDNSRPVSSLSNATTDSQQPSSRQQKSSLNVVQSLIPESRPTSRLAIATTDSQMSAKRTTVNVERTDSERMAFSPPGRRDVRALGRRQPVQVARAGYRQTREEKLLQEQRLQAHVQQLHLQQIQFQQHHPPQPFQEDEQPMTPTPREVYIPGMNGGAGLGGVGFGAGLDRDRPGSVMSSSSSSTVVTRTYSVPLKPKVGICNYLR